MPRIRRADRHAAEQATAAQQLAEMVGEPRERKRTMLSAPRALTEMTVMRENNCWTHARPVHLVALYCWCHEAIYGVAPDELATGAAGKRARVQAVGAARNMLSRDFGGNVLAMIGYIKWVWSRTKNKEEWAARAGAQVGRVGWQQMFAGRSLLTDYKVEIGRKRGAR